MGRKLFRQFTTLNTEKERNRQTDRQTVRQTDRRKKTPEDVTSKF